MMRTLRLVAVCHSEDDGAYEVVTVSLTAEGVEEVVVELAAFGDCPAVGTLVGGYDECVV